MIDFDRPAAIGAASCALHVPASSDACARQSAYVSSRKVTSQTATMIGPQPPYRWLNPLDSSLDMGTVTGCLLK